MRPVRYRRSGQAVTIELLQRKRSLRGLYFVADNPQTLRINPMINGNAWKESGIAFSTVWAMPSRHTFEIPPIAAFLDRWLQGCNIIVDPFCGRSTRGTHRNDLGYGGIDAAQWCEDLFPLQADAVLFDPPYSPRQISECYKGIGRKATMTDTQNAALYKRVRDPLGKLLRASPTFGTSPSVALSFGWQSSGFGKGYVTKEIMLVQHGGAHNDTICVAQYKISAAFDVT